jgi:hypothetical protein
VHSLGSGKRCFDWGPKAVKDLTGYPTECYEFGECIRAYSAQLSRIERLTMMMGGPRSGSFYTFDCCFWECVFAV